MFRIYQLSVDYTENAVYIRNGGGKLYGGSPEFVAFIESEKIRRLYVEAISDYAYSYFVLRRGWNGVWKAKKRKYWCRRIVGKSEDLTFDRIEDVDIEFKESATKDW